MLMKFAYMILVQDRADYVQVQVNPPSWLPILRELHLAAGWSLAQRVE